MLPHPILHFPCIQNFIDAIEDGRTLVSSGATALRIDWVTEQAKDSGNSGFVVGGDVLMRQSEHARSRALPTNSGNRSALVGGTSRAEAGGRRSACLSGAPGDSELALP